jgi:3-oxoadipate enol-lactonase
MLTVNGKQLALERHGGGTALIMVHGLGGTSNIWYPQIQVLSKRFDIAAVDLEGSGRSPVAGAISIDSLAADLVALIEALQFQKVHLVGHSMGTLVCQSIAARHPEKVHSLALLGAFPEPPEAARQGLRDRAAKARREGMTAIADSIVQAATSADTRINQPAAAAFVRELLMRQDPEGYARSCEALAAAHAVELSAIACPTLLVTGDEDRVAPPATMQAMASRIRGARTRIIGGCGHWPTVERPKQVNYALIELYRGLC